jgi:excinuclease UvrABC helicase subunit UvrB
MVISELSPKGVFRQALFPENGVEFSLSSYRDFYRDEEVTSSS